MSLERFYKRCGDGEAQQFYNSVREAKNVKRTVQPPLADEIKEVETDVAANSVKLS